MLMWCHLVKLLGSEAMTTVLPRERQMCALTHTARLVHQPGNHRQKNRLCQRCVLLGSIVLPRIEWHIVIQKHPQTPLTGFMRGSERHKRSEESGTEINAIALLFFHVAG